MEKILINISEKKLSKTINKEYINAYWDIYNKNKIKTFIFYLWENIWDISYEKKLKNMWIFLFDYKDNNSLQKKIVKLKKHYDIVYINTFTEKLIDTTIKLKEILKEPLTANKNIFRNKDIQRKLLLAYNPNITVKFLEKNIENLEIKCIEDFIWYPFVLKPSNWIQSAWVSKINSRDEFEIYKNTYKSFLKNFNQKGYDTNKILVEEFIDWEMYSIDYFVDKKWNITISKPVKVVLWVDIGIDDFQNYSRITSLWVEKELKNKNLKKFISDTVIWTWIKNNFVHHEFKINSKWELKTIELNWRIWWYRAWMMKRSYDINLLEYIIKNYSQKEKSLIENNSVIHIYWDKTWILKWFNKKIIEKIENLDSIKQITLLKENIWKEVWLTKDWFSKIIIIKLQNTSYEIFKKDYDFIEKNRKKLLVIN